MSICNVIEEDGVCDIISCLFHLLGAFMDVDISRHNRIDHYNSIPWCNLVLKFMPIRNVHAGYDSCSDSSHTNGDRCKYNMFLATLYINKVVPQNSPMDSL